MATVYVCNDQRSVNVATVCVCNDQRLVNVSTFPSKCVRHFRQRLNEFPDFYAVFDKCETATTPLMEIKCLMTSFLRSRHSLLVGTGLVIERLRGRVPAEAVVEFSSPELTVC